MLEDRVCESACCARKRNQMQIALICNLDVDTLYLDSQDTLVYTLVECIIVFFILT